MEPTSPEHRLRRLRQRCLVSGLNFLLVPGAIFALGPASINLAVVSWLWGLCGAAGATLVIGGLALRPRRGPPDHPSRQV